MRDKVFVHWCGTFGEDIRGGNGGWGRDSWAVERMDGREGWGRMAHICRMRHFRFLPLLRFDRRVGGAREPQGDGGGGGGSGGRIGFLTPDPSPRGERGAGAERAAIVGVPGEHIRLPFTDGK